MHTDLLQQLSDALIEASVPSRYKAASSSYAALGFTSLRTAFA